MAEMNPLRRRMIESVGARRRIPERSLAFVAGTALYAPQLPSARAQKPAPTASAGSARSLSVVVMFL